MNMTCQRLEMNISKAIETASKHNKAVYTNVDEEPLNIIQVQFHCAQAAEPWQEGDSSCNSDGGDSSLGSNAALSTSIKR